MYYPYFRGKQFELLAIKESARVIADAQFIPIIEPVRETLSALKRTLAELVTEGARVAVIINPRHGDHRHNSQGLAAHIEDEFGEVDSVLPAILITESMSLPDVLAMVSVYEGRPLMIVHAGFTSGIDLSNQLPAGDYTHVFLGARNRLYRVPFKNGRRILIEDGFKREKNADYGFIDHFSDLHITYDDLGGDGYGDFLTIGDHYAEGGGPAYAVAIHITFIDPENSQSMYVYHFVSDTNDTPVDPAGKFYQALRKLILEVDSDNSKILETSAIREFRDLNSRQHFPGLGYVKKLSIKHHLETLANYHSNA